MRSIEFRRVPAPRVRPDGGEAASVLEFSVDGVPFLELVRRAELPDALAEQQERAGEFAPDPAPLLAGDYRHPAGASFAHLLGGRRDLVPHGAEADETLVLGCTCGIDDCWALLARITLTDTTVTWSCLRNNSRDWDYSAIGTLTFSRREYEESLRAALDAR